MELDVTKRFDEIISSSGQKPTFKERILNTARYRISREQTEHWASHLRFLSSDNRDQIAGLCNVCAGTPCFRLGDRVLQLTQPNEAGTCRHYIAVSYCWEHNLEEKAGLGETYTVKLTINDRPNKAPNKIISRAISYAMDTASVNLIWIDQECIDQDDRTDKEFGIQSMDQAYHRAMLSLGLLNVTIRTQSEMDTLVMLLEGRSCESDQELRAAIALMHRFSQDRWFSCAWIFQESSLSLNLCLLVRCEDLLEKADICGQIPSEVKISMGRLQKCASSVLDSIRKSSHRPLLEMLQQIEEIEWWAKSLFPQINTYDFSTKRFACSAAEALHHLHFRRNSRPADRLAIIANLCQYHVRLDTTTLDQKTDSFSISLLTLSILNGDTSLLIDYLPGTSQERESRRQQRHKDVSSSFSWTLPLLPRFVTAGFWNSSSYLNGFDPNMRLQLSELQADGLLTVGWIWRIDRRVDLSSLRNKFHLRWTTCKQPSPPSSHHPDPLRTDNEDILLEINALSADFFYQLLQDLIVQDLQDVADAVWHLIRPT